MSKLEQTLGRVSGFVALSCVVLVGWSLVWPYAVGAWQPPPPPPPPDTPTHTATPTDTGTPTDTATPTDTGTATHTATATHTHTPAATDTHTPTATNTVAPAATATRTPTSSLPPPATATKTPSPEKTSGPKPDPNCESMVGGAVIDADGEGARGATVTMKGDGWSNSMLTDDNGHYGFGGLCAGTVTLQAVLPGGQTTPAIAASLTGKNNVQLDLRLVPADTATTQPTSTPEPNMPATGHPNWLLVGGALLAALLLLSAGARRALLVRGRTGAQD
jgi:cytoskeletal protein RodZ